MRRLHAEGRAGGQYGKLGGRPKKKRASEVAAEKIAEKGEELFNVLWERVHSENEKVSLDAIKQAFILEEQERKVEVEEEVRYEQLKHNELAELVIGNLFELVRSGQIDLGEIVEGEVVEDRPAIGTGEIN
jgi:hypothetical protein